MTGEEEAEWKSEVSKSWFVSFKQRSPLHDRQLQSKALSTNPEAAANYLEDSTEHIDVHGYTKDFRVDGSVFCKKLPSVWCKTSKGRLALVRSYCSKCLKLKTMLFPFLKTLRPLWIVSNLLCACSINGTKSLQKDMRSQYGLLNTLKALQSYCSNIFLFKTVLLPDTEPGQ